ncbi:MAG: Gfo/Idh/MocA family oxidoreductase [Gulosibacter sp.]|uniref:Gfo/Idh/MocA family oxidoreductase n=1 Tax=Gulosibacter sp. TaxID=2817531 RepID=UPI003F905128
MKLGLVGYGTGGRFFHAPYIAAADGVELVGIVARSEQRIAEVREDFPEVPIYASLTDMLEAGVDAVTITTPPETRRDLVLEAIAAGVHVIADKPFAPNAEGGRQLVAAAAQQGVLLSVFQNRRWDTDIRTLKQVLDQGQLGEVWRFESAFNLDEPESLEAGPTGGLLRDLGSHVVDQALWLFGKAKAVSANLDWIDLPEGRTDASFFINIEHENGVHSHISASKVNRLVSRELKVFAAGGSFISSQTDVQTQAIFRGERPLGNREQWGYEAEARWATLNTAEGSQPVPSAQGDYTDYYEQFAAAVDTGATQPVPASEAVGTLEVLDTVWISAAESRTVSL